MKRIAAFPLSLAIIRASLFILLWSCVSVFTAHAQLLPEQQLTSPRLKGLSRELGRGTRHALRDFWREVEKEGTPLVEHVKAEPRQMLVTFLWRAAGAAKNIVVFPLAAPDVAGNRMRRLGGTDIWYISYLMRDDARFTYRISADDALSSLATADMLDEMGARVAHFRFDPLNPHRFIEAADPEYPEMREIIRSVVELPNAPPQPFVRAQPGTPKGETRLIRYQGQRLKDPRRIYVYTPHGYTAAANPYRLLVLFDHWTFTQAGTPTPVILDNLIARGLIPPVVAVMVENPDRWEELGCNQTFADAFAQELIPWIREHYHVTSAPAGTIIGGKSIGGLGAAYIAFKHPEVFGNVLSQSGAFWWSPDEAVENEWLVKQFASAEKLPVRFYLEAGLIENGLTPGYGASMLDCSRHLRDVLQAKGYAVTYSEYNGGHDEICWRGSFSDGLIALLTEKER